MPAFVKRPTFWVMAAAIVVVLVPLGFSARRTWQAIQVNRCVQNLKILRTAIYSYLSEHGSLPPAYIADDEGRPLHSWRVLVLPYLGETELYNEYRLDEPWNGPNNIQLANRMPAFFRRPADSASPETNTSYVAVIGQGTCWTDEREDTAAIFKSKQHTLLLTEVSNSGICWLEPRDLPSEQVLLGINPAEAFGISSRHAAGAYASRLAGDTGFLPDSLSKSELEDLIEPASGGD